MQSPPRHVQEHDRVQEAARFCADALSGGWKVAVVDRASEYAQSTWGRLSRSRRKHNCSVLARLARAILKAKDRVHEFVGRVSGGIAAKFGVKGAAQAFAEELAANIPLPIDTKMIAVARALQITGVLLCVMEDRELTRCQCFVDLAMAETKERVSQILVAGMSDWTGLARFAP